MPNQISSQLPGGPVHSPKQANFIAYYKESSTKEQWYAGAPIGFGYHNATTLKVFYRGAQDVSAVDEIRITLAAGTSHTDAAEWLIFAEGFGQLHPTSEPVKRIVINGGQSMRPEFISCTITYGACCSGGGGSGTMSNWILSDGSTTQQIDNAETVTFADGTFINNVVSATNTVTTDLSATGTPNTMTFLRGDNTWSSPPNTTYAAMTNSVLGLGKLRYTRASTPAANAQTETASRTYGITDNASNQLVVNIPWTDTGGDAFTTMVPISGTSPVASGADTLNFTSLQTAGSTGIAGGTGGVAIAGDSGTDTLNISARRFESFVVTMTDEVRPITTGVKYEFRIPYNFTLSWYGGDKPDGEGENCDAPFKIMVNTPPGGGESVGLTVNVEISSNNRVSWASLFDVKPTIDGGEWSSVTAAARPQLASGDVIAYSINCDDVLRFTVDTVVGSPVGLKCVMLGYQAVIV
tara:strand:+ start:927 stop:2324 length:1398 start_codon:yes stop_codon:yes gene_type:complete